MILNLSKSELEIMQTLWAAGEPLTRAKIIELSPNRTWQEKSFNLIVNNMIEKEMIIIDGFAQSKKNFGRLYAPRYSSYEYLAIVLRQISPKDSDAERKIKFTEAMEKTASESLCE